MNTDSTAYMTGMVCGFILLALLPLFFVRDAIRAKTRSLRMANLALACGLSWLVFVEGLAPPTNRWLALGYGSARLLLGLLGVVFAIIALVCRTRDQGTGVARPVVGLFLSGWTALVGCALLVLPIFSPATADPGSSWIFTAPTHGYRLHLPSNRWKEFPTDKGEPSFACSMPRMMCKAIAVKAQQNETGYRATVKQARREMDRPVAGRQSVQHREGTTAGGNPYWYATCLETAAPGGQIFVATSVVFCRDKGLVVHMIFEGHLRMASQAGKSAEMQSCENAADYILTSVD